MNEQPVENPWVIRTDDSNDAAWQHICELIAAPQQDGEEEFFAYVHNVDDSRYRGQEPGPLVLSLPDEYTFMFCFVVDRETIENPEHPVLVIGFYPSDGESFDRPPRSTPPADIQTFRALPSQIQGIENNLSIANMDYEEFADAVDDDGVFRGFPG